MRRLPRLLSWPVLVLALVLGACSGDDDDDDDAVTVTTTTVPATETTSDPAATTSVVAASTTLGEPSLDPSDKVSTVGVGKVFFGMLLADARVAAGTDLVRGFGGDDCYFVTPQVGPPGMSFLIRFGRVARVDIAEPGVTTRSGIGVGSTVASTRQAYGAKLTESGTTLTFVPTDEGDANIRLVFESDGATITRYRAGQLPEVEDPDGCP